MKGDFTRNTFDPAKQFTRVLMQQGRVQLDADWNEQGAILLHYLQALAADLIGPHGGPDGGFNISRIDDNGGTLVDLGIGNGRYYVNGALCENLSAEATYYNQPQYPLLPRTDPLPAAPFLVYLDVWERLITAVEDDHIREVALGGVDTAARAQSVWQVKTSNKTADGQDIPAALPGDFADWSAWADSQWAAWLGQWQPENRGQLKARAKAPDARPDDACITPPDARYRGAENQLYRVEIHDGRFDGLGNRQIPTFKWSRDNGSVVFPLRRLSGKVAIVEDLGRDGRFTLEPGHWVEVVDDGYTLRGASHPLLKVQAVDRDTMTVILLGDSNVLVNGSGTGHPYLRRWDGYTKIQEGAGSDNWLSLEDGVQIQFQAAPNDGSHTYRSGDYWLIPARAATGDVEWPKERDGLGELAATAVPPNGVWHRYAPLALVTAVGPIVDLRRLLK